MSSRKDAERFVAGVEAHLVPAAQAEGFSAPAWIPRGEGETLCALRGQPLPLLVYLAAGHGINMTVCVAPEFRGAWNPRAHIRDLAARLPVIMASAKARGPSLWREVRALLEREIQAPRRSWKDLLTFWRRPNRSQ